jgi:hypothetical protein
MKTHTRVVIGNISAAALGFAVVVIPAALTAHRIYPAPLLPWVRAAIEEFSVVSAASFVAVGVLLGLMHPNRPVVLGVFMISAFPLIAVAEMVVDPTSHNLWPIEFIFYAVISALGIAGAYTGRMVRKWSSMKPVATAQRGERE